MTRTARNRFVAWLGIAAMWLAIVAPVISQTLAARQAADTSLAALCTVDTESAHAGHASADANEHAGHHDAAGHFEACSYCGLLAHNLPITQTPALAVARVERITRSAPLDAVSAPLAKSFNAASPRAPPVLS
jgi:hypothetical protein